MAQRERVALPDELESPRAKLIYLYLATAGGGTPDELGRRLDLSGLTVHSVLSTLEDRDVVDCEGERYYPVTGENSPVISQT